METKISASIDFNIKESTTATLSGNIKNKIATDLGTAIYGSKTNDHNKLMNRDMVDQHPISSITGLIDNEDGSKCLTNDGTYKVISTDANYVHNQIIASNSWVISHSLNKFPSVSIIDSGGSSVIGEISYTSTEQVVLSFTSSFGGIAYLN